MTTYLYPGSSNTVIPLFELSGELMVAYGRNLGKSVNKYSKVTPVKSRVGNYLQFNPLDLARLNTLPQKPNWPLSGPSPTGFADTIGFNIVPFRTDRVAFASTLDKTTVDIASFPIMKTHTSALAQKAHTFLAYQTCQALTTTSNFAATHVATASAANGTGFLSGGSTSDPRIKNALDYASRIIQQDTFGAVHWGQLSILMNNKTAQLLGSSREIREYVMQQVGSPEYLKMQSGDSRGIYGLPPTLYGYNVVVEDIYYNAYNRLNTNEGATPVMPDNTIVVFMADGDLEVPEGATSYATCHRFTYEEYSLETKDDVWNRLVEMRIAMDYQVQIVAPPTGFILTNLFY